MTDHTKTAASNAGEGLKKSGSTAKESIKEAGQGAKNMGVDAKKSVEETSGSVGRSVPSGVKKAGDAVSQGYQDLKNKAQA